MKKITFLLFCISPMFVIAQDYFGTSTFGNIGLETNYDIATDSQGNIFSVGFYSGTLTVGTTTVTYNGGNADGYLAKHDPQGNPLWIKSFGGTADDVAIAVAVDNMDNVIITGYFQGAGANSFDADPGPEVVQLSQPAAILSRDCFIVKVTNNGDFVWAKQVSNPAGGAANEDAKDIIIDTNNNIYIAGAFHYADFDTGVGQQTILASGNGNAQDGFVLKLDSAGNYVWVKTFYSVNHVVVESIDFDATGNLYVAGRYEGVLDLDPSTTVTQNATTSNGSHDAFLVKLNDSGDYVWGKVFGGSGYDNPKFVKTVGTDVYIGGTLKGDQDLDPSTGTNNHTVSGSSDGYISKFNAAGDYIGSYTIGGSTDTENEQMYRMTVGPNGNLFITGDFLDTADFDNATATSNSTSNGALDSYILEITPALTYVKHITVGGAGRETFSKIIFDSENAIVSTGSFNSASVDFDPYAGTNFIANNGNATYDVYFSRFSWDGIPLASATFAQKVFVYPNPAKDLLTISDSTEYDSYSISNTMGQIVKQKTTKESTIDVSDLSKGCYFLQLKGQNKTQNSKFIKE